MSFRFSIESSKDTSKTTGNPRHSLSGYFHALNKLLVQEAQLLVRAVGVSVRILQFPKALDWRVRAAEKPHDFLLHGFDPVSE